MALPTSALERKALPIATGVLDYFPKALAEVARVSKAGNDQHNPGQPLHWDKSKSKDEADALVRHLLERGGIDTDGMRHSAKVAWRALALLERELDIDAQKNDLGTVTKFGGIQNIPNITPLCSRPNDFFIDGHCGDATGYAGKDVAINYAGTAVSPYDLQGVKDAASKIKK